MRNPTLSAALILLAASNSSADPAASHIAVAVAPALAEIDPRPPGPRIIRLPNMSFTLHVDTQCGADMHAESAFISISDTRHSLGPERLGDSAGVEVTIDVPQKQLAPLTIENFCFSDIASGDNEDLHITDALSAQVSLRCVGENQQTIIYRVAPLHIALRCRTPDDN